MLNARILLAKKKKECEGGRKGPPVPNMVRRLIPVRILWGLSRENLVVGDVRGGIACPCYGRWRGRESDYN